MSTKERTRQQLDPIGTLNNRLLSVTLSTLAFVYGLVMTIRTLDQVSNVMLAILAMLWLAAASLTVTIATSPDRAPFTQSTHLAVQLLALGAVVLSVASQWGENRYLQDDFGPISLGILMLSLGAYRPATELATTGGLAAIFVGFITLLEVPALHSTGPPVALVVIGMTPILALSFASASYSGGIVESLERWQYRVHQSVEHRAATLREGIVRTVQRDRVRILSEDVLPFFGRVLEADSLTREDRERAREIASSIRNLMVAEADRTWLEVVAVDDGVSSDQLSGSVVDKAGRASAMSTDQRTALRAVIIALRDESTFVVGTMKIVITGTKTASSGALTAGFSGDENQLRATFAPYFAVMRIVFTAVTVEFRGSTLTLRFSYEQR